MVVGATPSSDRQILSTASHLYGNYKLRRIYYSAFSPIPDASRTLPAGLSLNPSSGAITGTPTASGSFPLTVKLKDTSSPFQTTTRAMTLVVAEPLVITSTTNNISQCTINAPCSITLTSTGGIAPISWSKPSGSLPPGLTLNPTTGVISGTPTAAGSYTVTVKAVDSANPAQADSKSLTLVVNPT